MTSDNPALGSRKQQPRPTVDGARHVRKFRSSRAFRAVTMSLLAVFTFVGVGLVSATVRLGSNVTAKPIVQLLGNSRPSKMSNPDDPSAGNALNIVLLGSDDRGDGDIVDDGAEGMRADTTMVMHISSDRTRVELVSIPRDSFVDIPSCIMSNDQVSAPSRQRFNAAFSIGWSQGGDIESAAACAITTIESLTNVYIDGYAVVDFGGFKNMVNALGGVPICVPNDMYAPKAQLDLKAGFQTLNGDQALGFARARTGKGVGDGSDTNRIGRQQELMSAISSHVFKQNLLTDLPKLYSFLDAATSSITADPTLANVKNLSGLAFSLRNIKSNKIAFLTVPWVPNPANANEVIWTDMAPQIWHNMANDIPLIPELFEVEPDPTDSPSTLDPDSLEGDDGGQTPAPTKKPGRDPFTSDDVTSQC